MAKARVLIVDDYEDNLVLLRAWLAGGDFDVAEAQSGEEALARSMEFRPDVILLDMRMPEPVDGWMVARRLRGLPEFASTVIVGVTAHAMVGDRERVLEVGCDDFMPKPIHGPDLVPTIRRLLEARRG
jgi:CheY-like chemotaxis protein